MKMIIIIIGHVLDGWSPRSLDHVTLLSFIVRSRMLIVYVCMLLDVFFVTDNLCARMIKGVRTITRKSYFTTNDFNLRFKSY